MCCANTEECPCNNAHINVGAISCVGLTVRGQEAVQGYRLQ